ncbi:MAG: glycoside hydrolase domain-containing protein, partial [Acidobacteriota bacterium]
VPTNAPSGYYTGTVTVTGDGGTVATLPVRLAVWDFTLPATSSLRSGFGLSWDGLCVQAYGSYSACGAYPGAAGNADRGTELTHLAEVNMLLDYHVSLAAAVYAPPDPSNWTHFDTTYGPLMTGMTQTQPAGAELTQLWYTGDLANGTLLASWADHFRSMGWLDRTSAYFCDEPPAGCSWAQAQSRADFIHQAAPGLLTLLTTDLEHATANDLLDRVDILVPVVDLMENPYMPSQRGAYDTWLARGGKHLWWYQSCDEHNSCSNGSIGPASPKWPSYMVDASPVRNRIFQWLAYVYRIEGELYYATDYCWTSSCGAGDPWTSLYAFGGNGDGTLFYPGTPAKIGGSTPVPVPSIRLALIRDGMEDYEYLHALDAIDSAAAHAAAATFITNNYTFDDDPAKLQAARLALGNALHAHAHP